MGRRAAFFVPLALFSLQVPGAFADRTVWFNPTGALLSGSGGFASPPTPHAIRLQHTGGGAPQTGTLTIPLALPTDGEIDSILVCYRTAPQDFPSKLTGIALRSMSLPNATITLLDDPTDRASIAGECLALDLTDVVPSGAVHLSIGTWLEPITFIEIGAIGVRMKSTTLVGLLDGEAVRPSTLALSPGRPNPFAGTTRISYRLSEPGHVRLRVFDIAGRQVRALVDRDQGPGDYEEQWDGRGENGRALPPGLYLSRLSVGGEGRSERMILLD